MTRVISASPAALSCQWDTDSVTTTMVVSVWLFAAQDTVEAAWRVAGPVLGDVVSGAAVRRRQLGPKQADSLLPAGGTWHNPAG
jgi:glucose-6-phosphate 1-dehydrogenase